MTPKAWIGKKHTPIKLAEASGGYGNRFPGNGDSPLRILRRYITLKLDGKNGWKPLLGEEAERWKNPSNG